MSLALPRITIGVAVSEQQRLPSKNLIRGSNYGRISYIRKSSVLRSTGAHNRSGLVAHLVDLFGTHAGTLAKVPIHPMINRCESSLASRDKAQVVDYSPLVVGRILVSAETLGSAQATAGPGSGG